MKDIFFAFQTKIWFFFNWHAHDYNLCAIYICREIKILIIVPSWKCESRGLNLLIQGVLRTSQHRTLAKRFSSAQGKCIHFFFFYNLQYIFIYIISWYRALFSGVYIYKLHLILNSGVSMLQQSNDLAKGPVLCTWKCVSSLFTWNEKR